MDAIEEFEASRWTRNGVLKGEGGIKDRSLFMLVWPATSRRMTPSEIYSDKKRIPSYQLVHGFALGIILNAYHKNQGERAMSLFSHLGEHLLTILV